MKLRAVEISAIAFFIGIWLGLKFPFHHIFVILGITLIILAAILARRAFFRVATVLAAIGFFAVGGFLIKPYREPSPYHPEIKEVLNRKIDVCGRVSWFERLHEGAEIVLDQMTAEINGSEVRLRGKLRVKLDEQVEKVGGGERACFFNLTPHLASTYRNPGGFDYQYYLKLQGIEAVASAKAKNLDIQGRMIDPFSLILRVRAKIRKALDQNFSNPYRAQLKALILGEQKEIPEELWDIYYVSGIAHLPSISGFHIGVIAAVAYAFGWWLLRKIARPNRYIDATKFVGIVTMIPIVIYTLIAGARAPSLRSAIMAALVFLALARKRPPKLRAVVFSAALLVGLLWPPGVLTASYQLSFAAAMALIVLVPRFHKLLKQQPQPTILPTSPAKKISRSIADSFFVSLAANIGVLPFLIFYFHRLSIIAPIANLVILPIVALFLPLIVLGGFLTLIWEGFGVALLQVVRPSLWLMDKLAYAFTKVPCSSVWTGTIDWWEILLCGLGFAAILAKTKRLRLLAIPCFGAIVFWEIWLGNIAPALKKDLTITFIDVGQGDSELIEAPNSTRILIDGGGVETGSFDIGKSVVAPVLWKKRIRSLDLVILTHSHPDHFDGLRFITENFKIGQFEHPNLYCPDPRYKELLNTLAAQNIPTKIVDISTPKQTLNAVQIDFLNPPPEVRDQGNFLSNLSLNDKSLALKIRWKNFSLLIMGDASIEAQKLILSASKNLKANVIKIAHHGARDAISSDFLDKVKPQAAVISVGARNIYGSPHAQILGILLDNNIATFRTDEDGAIIVNATEREFSICGWSSKRCKNFEEQKDEKP